MEDGKWKMENGKWRRTVYSVHSPEVSKMTLNDGK
jgi:hypothetical protein